MPRRKTVNRTNIPRIKNIPVHQALALFVCIRCSCTNLVNCGNKILNPTDAYETQSWKCTYCGFIHSKTSPLPLRDNHGRKLPFSNWDKSVTQARSLATERFWRAFFLIATESREAYWKQCKTCGRKLPERAFSGHAGWGPLEKQLECRSCKAVINTKLNPKRTKQQLHESAVRRRTADMLVKGVSQRIDHVALFDRFKGKCFKTGKTLRIEDRDSWAIDHTLPSCWLYPLTKENATLLSIEANNNKSGKWPSEYYTNKELKKLAAITGANLELIASKQPIINPDIDVNACIERMLTVRSATDIAKRISELKKLLEDYGLTSQLSIKNKKLLGYTK